MKNAWLGSAVGVVLGGAAVWGYLGYSGQSTATATVQQPKTTQQSPESKKSSFLSQELVDARLNELSFKEFMRLFYKDNMRNVFVNEGEIEIQNFVAIGSADEAGENTVALMHPIINYRNVEGEARFLVMIEKVQVSENGSVVSCHACVGNLDLYSFKKLTNGQFQVVSKSRPEQEYGGSYGRVHVDREQILNNMQPIGKKLIGSFYQSGYSSTGETSSSWNVIHLPEDNFIGAYGVADAAGDNAGNYEPESPLHFTFDSTIEVIDNDKKYFPIQVSYSGEKPNADYSSIEPTNQQLIVNYNPEKKEYQ